MTDKKWQKILDGQREIKRKRDESNIDYFDLQPWPFDPPDFGVWSEGEKKEK